MYLRETVKGTFIKTDFICILVYEWLIIKFMWLFWEIEKNLDNYIAI